MSLFYENADNFGGDDSLWETYIQLFMESHSSDVIVMNPEFARKMLNGDFSTTISGLSELLSYCSGFRLGMDSLPVLESGNLEASILVIPIKSRENVSGTMASSLLVMDMRSCYKTAGTLELVHYYCMDRSIDLCSSLLSHLSNIEFFYSSDSMNIKLKGHKVDSDYRSSYLTVNHDVQHAIMVRVLRAILLHSQKEVGRLPTKYDLMGDSFNDYKEDRYHMKRLRKEHKASMSMTRTLLATKNRSTSEGDAGYKSLPWQLPEFSGVSKEELANYVRTGKVSNSDTLLHFLKTRKWGKYEVETKVCDSVSDAVFFLKSKTAKGGTLYKHINVDELWAERLPNSMTAFVAVKGVSNSEWCSVVGCHMAWYVVSPSYQGTGTQDNKETLSEKLISAMKKAGLVAFSVDYPIFLGPSVQDAVENAARRRKSSLAVLWRVYEAITNRAFVPSSLSSLFPSGNDQKSLGILCDWFDTVYVGSFCCQQAVLDTKLVYPYTVMEGISGVWNAATTLELSEMDAVTRPHTSTVPSPTSPLVPDLKGKKNEQGLNSVFNRPGPEFPQLDPVAAAKKISRHLGYQNPKDTPPVVSKELSEKEDKYTSLFIRPMSMPKGKIAMAWEKIPGFLSSTAMDIEMELGAEKPKDTAYDTSNLLTTDLTNVVAIPISLKEILSRLDSYTVDPSNDPTSAEDGHWLYRSIRKDWELLYAIDHTGHVKPSSDAFMLLGGLAGKSVVMGTKLLESGGYSHGVNSYAMLTPTSGQTGYRLLLPYPSLMSKRYHRLYYSMHPTTWSTVVYGNLLNDLRTVDRRNRGRVSGHLISAVPHDTRAKPGTSSLRLKEDEDYAKGAILDHLYRRFLHITDKTEFAYNPIEEINLFPVAIAPHRYRYESDMRIRTSYGGGGDMLTRSTSWSGVFLGELMRANKPVSILIRNRYHPIQSKKEGKDDDEEGSGILQRMFDFTHDNNAKHSAHGIFSYTPLTSTPIMTHTAWEDSPSWELMCMYLAHAKDAWKTDADWDTEAMVDYPVLITTYGEAVNIDTFFNTACELWKSFTALGL